MSNCAVCGHQVSPDSAFCDNCGTPNDGGGAGSDAPTSIGTPVGSGGGYPSGGGQPGQPGQPGQYGGGQGWGGQQGQPFGQQGNQGNQYGQPFGGAGGAGGGYGGGGQYGAPVGGNGGGKKKTGVIIGAVVAVLAVIALGTGIFLATNGGDDDEAGGGGGGESSSEPTAAVSTDPSGLVLGGPNDVEVNSNDEVVIEVSATDEQVVLLGSEDAGDLYIFPSDLNAELTNTAALSTEGLLAFQPNRSGTQVLEFTYYGDRDEVELFVDVIDVQELEPGDPIEVSEAKPFSAAVYDLEGLYASGGDIFFGTCTREFCQLDGDTLVIASANDQTPEEAAVETVAGTWSDGSTSIAFTMPPGGATKTFTASEEGTITVRQENVDEEVDFKLVITDESGEELCNADATLFDDEVCVIEVEPGIGYRTTVSEWNDDPAETGDVVLHLE